MDIVTPNQTKISEGEVAAFEHQCGYSLPEEYRAFLLQTNGGIPLKSEFHFIAEEGLEDEGHVRHFFPLNALESNTGIVEQLAVLYLEVPSGYIPIAEDSYGNKMLISCVPPDYGSIYYWDHEQEEEDDLRANLFVIAPSFTEFVSGFFDLPPLT